MSFDFTPDDERSLYDELDRIDARRADLARQMNPDLSTQIGAIYQQYPDVTPDVLYPAARAYNSGMMSQEDLESFMSKFRREEYQRKIAEQKPKKKNWWERNIVDKVKTGSRWTFAALNFVPQVLTNVASQAYRLGRGQDIGAKGFFISTDLGTLMQNDDVAGDGFFVGGRAFELQAQRAREYRGTIDGQAFTFGRAIARTVAQPGSDAYRLLSGLVDAAAAMYIPSIPGSKSLQAGAKTLGIKTGMRTLAGLTNYESAMIITEKVAPFLNSTAGRKLVEKLTNAKHVDEVMQILPTADAKYLTEIARITDQNEMKNFLADSLGSPDANRGIGPKNIDDINISRWSDFKQYVGKNSFMASMMASMPGHHVLLMAGDEREKLKSIKDVNNYLKILKNVPKDVRNKLVDDLADALVKDDGSLRGTIKQLDNVIRESFRAMDVDEKLVNQLVQGVTDFKKIYENALHGAISNTGDAADYGIWMESIIDGKVVTTKMALNTAALQSEGLKHAIMLPDVRQTRRLVSQQVGSRLGWLTGKGGWINPEIRGELRMPFAAIEWAQNQIWRPLTLLTGGYVLRNMMDSLLRQSASKTVRTGVFHPFELINVAIHKKNFGDILGASFKLDDAEGIVRNAQKELAEAASGTIRESRDPIVRLARERTTGVWKIVRRSQGDDLFMQGIAAELSLLASDQVARQVAAGKDLNEIMSFLTETNEGKKYLQNLQNMWSNRTLIDEFGNKATGTVDIINKEGKVNTNNVEKFVSEYVVKRMEEVTGGDLRLKQMIGMVDPEDSKVILSGKIVGEDGSLKDVMRFDNQGRIDGYFEDNIYPTIRQVLDDPNVTLKEAYKVQETADFSLRGQDPLRDRMFGAWDIAVDKFFAELYPKREAFLNRSPVFRQEYYNVIRNFIDELAPGEVKTMLSSLEDIAKKNGGLVEISGQGKSIKQDWLANYVGDKELAQKIVDKASGKLASEGKITLTQLDAYAKGYALDETKRLFYNAAEKSNFADVLRVIAPFGSAWAEVTKRWVGDLSTNPELLKKFGATVKGLQQADPDGDGKGFFYKDPQTGEYVFNYPFSEQLAPFMMGLGGAVTGGILGGFGGALALGGAAAGGGALLQNKLEGVSPQFVAPVKSLSMGLSILPGVGPYAQMAAGKIIGNKPEADWIRKILVPYGTPDASKLVLPAWADKLSQAIIGNPENDRKLGDLVMDTMKALSATGDYNLKNPDERERLEKDAISKARVLLVLSSIGQFSGPTRPGVEFKVNTKQGDVMANELAKAFYEMQAVSYDTAVEEFISTFGEDAFMYVAGKTKAVAGGLEATKEFGDWEVKNKSLFKKYPEVAGYFAPGGTTFDYQAYVRQIETGMRERLSPQELIAEAQFRVGSALYRKVRRMMGANPSTEQEDFLRTARKQIGFMYPGFRDRSIDVTRQQTRITRLYEAANDSSLDGNPIASTLRTYLGFRDQALQIASDRGYVSLGGKGMADVRGYLADIGEKLAAKYPEFERLWERVLFAEVDLGE